MRKVDVAVIGALTVALNLAVDEYKHAVGTDRENEYLFRMNFIQKFSADTNFLNNLSGSDCFYNRYADLILRNMTEQLIEFLYIIKKKFLIDEYLGFSINLDELNRKDIVKKEKYFGEERFVNKRERIKKMTQDIGEYRASEGALSLYNVYSILSEKCHNSYFGSLIDDFNEINIGVSKTGLTEEQMNLIYIMVLCVLKEYTEK